MKSLLLVFLGGGLGASLRYWIDLKITSYLIVDSVFIVNFIGSFILGVLFSYLLKNQSFQPLYLLLGTGFCGGFTTFSSFSAKGFSLLQSGQIMNYAYYSIGSLILGLLMFGLGYYTCQKLIA